MLMGYEEKKTGSQWITIRDHDTEKDAAEHINIEALKKGEILLLWYPEEFVESLIKENNALREELAELRYKGAYYES